MQLESVQLDDDEQIADIARALEAVVTWLRRASQNSSLSLSSLSALSALDSDGPLRVTQLAAREGLSQPGMTTLLNRLEDADLAIRQPDPDDGRASLISITDGGREILNAYRASRQRLISERLATLTGDDLAVLRMAVPALDHFTATDRTEIEAPSR